MSATSAVAPWTLCPDGVLKHPLTDQLKPPPPLGLRDDRRAPHCDIPGCAHQACSTGAGGNWRDDRLQPHRHERRRAGG